jgi:hypothetical protein
MCVMYLHTKFPRFVSYCCQAVNGTAAILLFCMYEKKSLVISCIFFQDLLSCIIVMTLLRWH